MGRGTWVDDDLGHDGSSDALLLAIGEEYEPYDTVTNFEDLRAWQYARALTKLIYQLSVRTPLSQDFGLCRQMQRSAVSIMSNIAEGHERGSTREYLRFLNFAKASCAELRSQAYVLYDVGYIDQPAFEQLLSRITSLNQLTGALRAAIARRVANQT